jgi:hypothetical protein
MLAHLILRHCICTQAASLSEMPEILTGTSHLQYG